VLKQPRPHDVGGELGKNATLLLLFVAVCFGIFIGRSVAGADTVVQAVACK